jgi:aromatic ring-cleaving dioxygenase
MKSRKSADISTATPDEGHSSQPHDAAARAQRNEVRSEVRLGREVQARIGQQLRAMYDQVVKEGVPPRFAELMRRLSDQDDGVA